MMFTCPNCGEPGVSRIRKFILSPGLPATCKHCGKMSGTQYAPWLATVTPGSSLLVAALLANTAAFEWALNAIGIVLMFAVPYWFLPLQKEPVSSQAEE